MDFKQLQAEVVANALAYQERYQVVIDEDFALLKLCEEVGELAQAVLIARRKCRPEKYLPAATAKANVAHELADIVGMALVAAHLLGIDLEEALQKKWIKKEG